MPRRYRRTKRRTQRRPRRKRRTGFNARQGSGIDKTYPLAKSFKFNTRYVDQRISLDSSAGETVSHVFCLNGMYDPDITGTGHQPLGFDQMMAMYDHYTVIGARARVTFSNIDTSYQQCVALQIKDTNTTSTDFQNILENGQCRWTTLAPEGTGGSTKTLTINCGVSKFFGRKVMADDKYQGNISSNPSDGVFLHILANPLHLTAVSEVRCTVIIEYIAVLTEPKQLAGS